MIMLSILLRDRHRNVRHLQSMTDFPVATYLWLRSSSLALADDRAHLAGETR